MCKASFTTLLFLITVLILETTAQQLPKQDVRFIQLQVTNGNFEHLEAHFYNPGESKDSNLQGASLTSQSCSCMQFDYLGRNDWCPDGDCPPDSTPIMTDATHLIVHHSEGTNSATDWAAHVRGMWDYHVNTLGYDDIAYNWLIDPNGVIYEGRGDNNTGAAFCATNFGVISVCVLGNFDLVEPTEEAKESLVEWLAWSACDKDIDPLGSSFHEDSGLTLNNIAGHRDGCNISSPGDNLYAELPLIRNQVSDFIDTACVTNTKDYFNPSTVVLAPNPVRERLTVHVINDLFGKIQFHLFDLQGRLQGGEQTAEKNASEQTFYLNTEYLQPGFYLLQVTHELGTASFKIVKR